MTFFKKKILGWTGRDANASPDKATNEGSKLGDNLSNKGASQGRESAISAKSQGQASAKSGAP